jgi:hypothetical protein
MALEIPGRDRFLSELSTTQQMNSLRRYRQLLEQRTADLRAAATEDVPEWHGRQAYVLLERLYRGTASIATIRIEDIEDFAWLTEYGAFLEVHEAAGVILSQYANRYSDYAWARFEARRAEQQARKEAPTAPTYTPPEPIETTVEPTGISVEGAVVVGLVGLAVVGGGLYLLFGRK